MTAHNAWTPLSLMLSGFAWAVRPDLVVVWLGRRHGVAASYVQQWWTRGVATPAFDDDEGRVGDTVRVRVQMQLPPSILHLSISLDYEPTANDRETS
jgi:hypothetical protein